MLRARTPRNIAPKSTGNVLLPDREGGFLVAAFLGGRFLPSGAFRSSIF
jgi:hypothetical protein